MALLFVQGVGDSGGGIRTVADVWEILLVAALVVGILAWVVWRFVVLSIAAVRSNLKGKRQAVELFVLGGALFARATFVVWAVWWLSLFG